MPAKILALPPLPGKPPEVTTGKGAATAAAPCAAKPTAPPAKRAQRRKKPVIRPLSQVCRELLVQPSPEGIVELNEVETVASQLTAVRGMPLELYETVLLVQLKNALKGDTRAAAFLRDSANEKTKDAPVQTALAPGDKALLQKLERRLQQAKEAP